LLVSENVDMDAKAPLAHCDDCPLRDRPFVPGYGPTMTGRVIVGEAPGQNEVFQGKPFVGRAGGRLNEALAAAEVDRLAVYITNTVLCHPEGNQSPPPEAVEACHERLITEVRLRMPRKVLALGTTAGKALTGDTRPIEKLRLLRPTPSPYLDSSSEARVTCHPSALTRNPDWPGRFDGDVGGSVSLDPTATSWRDSPEMTRGNGLGKASNQ
jgi:uracil-DNA glycosylase family 4